MKTLLLLFAVLISAAFQSQDYGFITYSQSEGLAQSQVRSMFLDSRGRLWIGTVGGMSRFDGEKFETYSKFTGMFDDHANVIKELDDGRIAIGSVGGISILSDQKFINYKFDSPYDNAYVSDFEEIGKDEFLISTFFGIFILKDGVTNEIPINSDIKRSHKILKLKDGTIYITIGHQLYEYSDEQINLVVELPKKNSTILDIVNYKSSILIATNNIGLFEYKAGQINLYGLTDSVTPRRYKCLHIDNSGELWIGTSLGVLNINKGVVSSYDIQNGLPSNEINCIESDINGNIWFGTEANGFTQFTSKNIKHYTVDDGLTSNLIMAIEEFNSDILIGSYDGGLSILGENSSQINDLGTGDKHIRIWDIQKVDDNSVLFATDRGLIIKHRDNSTIVVDESDGLNSRRLKCIYLDLDGRMWIGSNDGVNIIESDSLYKFDFPPEYHITKVRSIIQDIDGHFWFACKQGLVSYKEGKFEFFNSDNGLFDESVYTLEKEENGRVWIGTRNGLHYFDNNELKLIQIAKNSPSNHINFLKIIPGESNILVIGTNAGIYGLNTTDIESKDLAFHHISEQQGLLGLETNQNAVFLDKDNLCWVGTTEGLSVIKNIQTLFNTNQNPPQIHIENIRLNLEEVNWPALSDEINFITGLPSSLTVDHKKNHFTFSFQGISYGNSSDLKYQYMLEGYNNNWQPITTDKIATYSNLPYENFTFLVRSKSKNSDWSVPTSFSFSITAPFWRTWWFYSVSLLIIFTLVYLIYLRRKKTLFIEREKEKFELQSKMLSLEQQSLNSSMNRHFIFNSLNSIQYYINRKDRLSANKYLSSFAKLIRKNLDSSQANTTKLSEELERLGLYIELEQMRFQDRFNYNLDIDKSVNPNEVSVPSMLLQPFLENSIWHGILPKSELGKIDLSIKENNDSLLITIRDNGIGILTSINSKKGKIDHDSKGMSITKGRIDLIRKMGDSSIDLIGPEELKNEEGKTIGTEVRIQLPINLKENYFN